MPKEDVLKLSDDIRSIENDKNQGLSDLNKLYEISNEVKEKVFQAIEQKQNTVTEFNGGSQLSDASTSKLSVVNAQLSK